MENPQDAADNEAGELISTWLEIVDRVAPGNYVQVEDLKSLPDGQRVQSDSLFWSERFFKKEASPYNPTIMVRRSIHSATEDTFDMLRHEYASLGVHLVVIETVSFILIHAEQAGTDLVKLEQPDRPDAVTQIAQIILNMSGTCTGGGGEEKKYIWIFRFPPILEEGIRFSTNPGAHPRLMWSWADRLDCGIRNGGLYFFCYKQRGPADGKTIFLDGHHWFDGKCWASGK